MDGQPIGVRCPGHARADPSVPVEAGGWWGQQAVEPGCWVPHLAVASPRTAARAKAAAAPDPRGGVGGGRRAPRGGTGAAPGWPSPAVEVLHVVVGRRWQAPPTLTLEWGRRGGDGRGGDREGPTPASPRTAALPWSSSAGRARGGRPPRLLLQHRVTGSPAGPVHARPCVLFLLSKLAVSCSPIPGFKTNFYYNNLFILHLNYSVLKGHFKTPTALSLEEGVWSAGSSKMRTPLRTAGEDRA